MSGLEGQPEKGLVEIVAALAAPHSAPGWPSARHCRRECGWAEMIRKVDEVDPLVCPQCGGGMKVIAFLTDYAVVGRIINQRMSAGINADRKACSAGVAQNQILIFLKFLAWGRLFQGQS